MSTLREFPGKDRIDCNVRDLDEARGHGGLPCVEQERKLGLSQGSDCQPCHMGGENPEKPGKGSSRAVFSCLSLGCPWNQQPAFWSTQSGTAPWGHGHISFAHPKGSDTHF